MAPRSPERHGLRRTTRLAVEQLEARTLLHGSISLSGGVLDFQGSVDDNVMTVVLNPSAQTIDVSLDGEPAQSFPVSQVTELHISGLGGNDDIGVDAALVLPTRIDGGPGNDTLRGGSGSDTMDGGDGADLCAGGGGADSIMGGEGPDTLRGRAGPDTIDGGGGRDLIQGAGGSDLLDGGDGDDCVFGGRGNDTCVGGLGNDILHGDYPFGTRTHTPGNNSLDGGDGDDILLGGSGADTFTGGNGIDLFAPLAAGQVRNDFGASDADADETVIPDADYTNPSLKGVRTDLLPGAPDISDRHHDNTLDDSFYALNGYTNPPTYGPHHSHAVGTNGHLTSAPVQPTGIWPIELPDTDVVHNLEHGHVWISYNPSLIRARDLTSLQLLVSAYGTGRGIVLAPRSGNTSDEVIALVSWAHLQKLTGYDLTSVRDFIHTNRGHGPEGFITP